MFIPSPMRRFTGGQAQAQVTGRTLGELVNNLERLFPGIREQLVEEEDLISGLAAIIDGEATVEGLLQKLREDAEVHFLPAIAGGSSGG